MTPGGKVSERVGHGSDYNRITVNPEGRCGIVRSTGRVNEAKRPIKTRLDADNARANPAVIGVAPNHDHSFLSPGLQYARIAMMSGSTPRIVVIRFRSHRPISVLTSSMPLVGKELMSHAGPQRTERTIYRPVTDFHVARYVIETVDLGIDDAVDRIGAAHAISPQHALRDPERTYANRLAGPASDLLRRKTSVNEAHCVQGRDIETICLNGKWQAMRLPKGWMGKVAR